MPKIYASTYSIDIVALFYLFVLLRGSNMLDVHRKKPFLWGIVLTIIIILAEAGTILAGDGNPGLRDLNILCNILGFALTPIIPIALIHISDVKAIQTHKLLLLPTLVNIVAVVLSPWLKLIFYIDGNNQYRRGDYFVFFVMIYIINLSFLVISTLYTCKRYHYPIKGKMIALSLFTVAGTSIQLVDPSVYSSWHCVTLSLFLYFLLLSEFDGSFDALTGLYNRAAYEKMAEQTGSRKAFSVVVLDIDNFKNVNDTYGHDYGDTAMKTVAAIIRESLDGHYACYRTGGDEFCVICDETNQEKIENRLRNMTNALSEKRKSDRRLPTITYGYGVFQGGKAPDFRKILKEADDQMYSYKKLRKYNKPKPSEPACLKP